MNMIDETQRLSDLKELRAAIDSMISNYENGAVFLNRRPISPEERQFFEIYDFRVRNFAVKKLDL